MNISTAWRFMVAARDNPVLAAWASVCDGFCPAVASDISPYDAWDAYQYLFNHGFVSAAQFDNTDVKLLFFSGHPSTCEIQEVLERSRFLCPEHEPTPTEKPMANENPFFSNSNALATRGKPKSGNGLSEARRSESLGNPFSPKREVMPQSRQGESLGMEAFAPKTVAAPSGLDCQRPDDVALTRALGQPRIHCAKCGTEVSISEDGGQRKVPGDGEYGPLLLTVFYGQCCDLVYHCSVANDPHPDELQY
jgi:hypothetical protein